MMRQTGVSLKYMMDFGSRPSERNLLLSAQFLHKELPIRIARRAVELENLPYGLSLKHAVLTVSLSLSLFLNEKLEVVGNSSAVCFPLRRFARVPSSIFCSLEFHIPL